MPCPIPYSVDTNVLGWIFTISGMSVQTGIVLQEAIDRRLVPVFDLLLRKGLDNDDELMGNHNAGPERRMGATLTSPRGGSVNGSA